MMTGHKRVMLIILLIVPVSLMLLSMIRYEMMYVSGGIPGLAMVVPAKNPAGVSNGE